jgi:HEAT repeat protein
MRLLWAPAWLFVALPLGAQPKLLVNAQVDTHSAASGLTDVFRGQVAASSQAAWIGYSIPALHGGNLGCDYVRDGGATAGVVHLELPDSAIILFRIERNAVGRIRALSPYCEIDAGGLPVHWIADVGAADSIALLATFAPDPGPVGDGAVSALAVHQDPAGGAALERLLAPDQPEWLRLRTVSRLASRGPGGLDVLKRLISADSSQNVRRRAVSALIGVAEGAGIPVLVELVKSAQDPAIRKQAMSSLQQSHDPRALAFFEEVLKR